MPAATLFRGGRFRIKRLNSLTQDRQRSSPAFRPGNVLAAENSRVTLNTHIDISLSASTCGCLKLQGGSLSLIGANLAELFEPDLEC